SPASSRCAGTTSRSASSTTRCGSPRSSAISTSCRPGKAPTTCCRATKRPARRAREMKATLKPGLTHRFSYRVPDNKTRPNPHPEVADFQAMPRVFATGYMVGLMEWACMQLMAPHLDPGEGSLGVHIDVNHTAATPPGLTVTVDVECVEVVG